MYSRDRYATDDTSHNNIISRFLLVKKDKDMTLEVDTPTKFSRSTSEENWTNKEGCDIVTWCYIRIRSMYVQNKIPGECISAKPLFSLLVFPRCLKAMNSDIGTNILRVCGSFCLFIWFPNISLILKESDWTTKVHGSYHLSRPPFPCMVTPSPEETSVLKQVMAREPGTCYLYRYNMNSLIFNKLYITHTISGPREPTFKCQTPAADFGYLFT